MDLKDPFDALIELLIKWPGARIANGLYRLNDRYEEERGFQRQAPAAAVWCAGLVFWAILIAGVLFAIR